MRRTTGRRAVQAALAACAVGLAAGTGRPGGVPGGGQAQPICGEVALVSADAEQPPPAAVYELQLGLRMLSLFPYPLDGRYDRRTRQAVEQFQRSEGLTPDGVAGPQTWAALARRFEQHLAELMRAQREAARAEPEPQNLPRHPDARPDGYWIVIDTARLRLSLYRGQQLVQRWPVAVGKPSSLTPVGEWRVVHKARDWGGGFGTRWLGLDVPWGIYGIHGTNARWT